MIVPMKIVLSLLNGPAPITVSAAIFIMTSDPYDLSLTINVLGEADVRYEPLSVVLPSGIFSKTLICRE